MQDGKCVESTMYQDDEKTGQAINLSSTRLTHIIYGLYGASLILGVTMIVAIVLNYIKREDVKGTFLESHFTWQIRTFWFTLMWSAIGIITMIVGVGFLVLIGAGIWFVYRIVKGWLALNDNRPIG